MPRKPYKYHYIYKTTNIVNSKFYVGMHSTDNLGDGYLGSGTVLARSIRKYGRENFIKEILEYFPDRESLRKREAEIVNEKFVNDKMCMNVKVGGEKGNFGSSMPNRKSSPLSESHKANISKSCEGKAGKYEKSKDHRQKLAEANLGKKQDDKTKEKRSESLRNFWKENLEAETSRSKKSKSLKEAWKLRKGTPQKPRTYTKPLSMTPGAIRIREARQKQKTKTNTLNGNS
jgi:hypothetical protein